MMRQTLAILLAMVLWSKTAHAQPDDYLALKRKLYSQWEQVMEQYPTGPAREAAFEKYVNQPLARLDPDRIGDFQAVCRDAEVPYDKELFSAGSPPWSPQFKKGGDLDTQAQDMRAYYRMRAAAKARGLKVTDNGNSFSIQSHEVTVHMPPSPYNDPTSQAAHERAMQADQEAAEYIAQGGTTRVPTTRGPVTLRRNVMRTPVAEMGDYYKKAHEARGFLEGPNIGRQQVIESMNFSNKAAHKTEQMLRKAGIDPGMAIHRKTSVELDAMLGNRKGAEAVAFARRQNDNAFRQLNKMLDTSIKATSRQVADLRRQISMAEKAGDTTKAIALRQQLVNTRNLINRTASQAGRNEIVRKVFQEGDDVAGAGAKGTSYLKKLSEKFGRMTPALKKLGRVLLKGLSVVARAAEIHGLCKEYEAAEQRETDWARKIGRDPSTGGIAKEFVFGVLGFHRAKADADRVMALEGKDPEPLDWEYVKTFVAAYAREIDDLSGPLSSEPYYRVLAELHEIGPEAFAKKYGARIEDMDQPAESEPPDVPASAFPEPDAPEPAAPPPMVVASLQAGEKEKAKDPKESKDESPAPPPMVAASLGKKAGEEPRGSREKKPEAVDSDEEKGASDSTADTVPPQPQPPEGPSGNTTPAPKGDSAGFKANKPYTVRGMALETEQRKCRVGHSPYKIFEGVVEGSEMSVVVHQNGRNYILSGDTARLVLEKHRYIERQVYCGYVTTKQYADFGPGITQQAGGKPAPQINWNAWRARKGPGTKNKGKCIRSICETCSFWLATGAPMSKACLNCLNQNQQKLISCGGP